MSDYASEGGHYYLPDGTPFYEIECKSRPGKRPVTVTDARKVNAVPSVTTVLGNWNKRALNTWRERNVHEATVALMHEYNGIIGNPETFWKEVQERAQRPREQAADRGTQVHADIERFLLGQEHGHLPHITNICATLAAYGIDLKQGASEKSFAHSLGYGGKVDWHQKAHRIGDKDMLTDGIVLDIKSKPNEAKIKEATSRKKYCLGYISQLAAYREGLGMPDARCLNVFVGTEDAQVIVLDWTNSDLKSGYDFFYALLRAWKIDNTYWPKL